jgi:uncharacterized protein YtpQ (UPF0354 family)
MKGLLGILVVVVGMSGAALAQNLSPRAFTEEFADQFRRAIPSATITRGDLEITVRRPSGSTTINLANAYATYWREPQRLRELISTQLALVAPLSGAPIKAEAKLDPSKIVPVIKGRAWLRDVQEQIKKSGSPQEQLFDDFNGELVVAYAEDTSKAMRYLAVAEYSGDRAQLRALAVDNLLRVLPKVEMAILNEHVSMISAGDDYTASLLLIEHIWTGGQIKVQGDIVVAVPTRDIILVTGSRNSMLKNFRATAATAFAKGPYSLTDALFVYRNKRFTKFSGG